MELRVKYVLGSELAEVRRLRNLTQEEAAEQLGVSPRTWQGWEMNGNVVPRAKHRRRLIDWLEKTEAAA